MFDFIFSMNQITKNLISFNLNYMFVENSPEQQQSEDSDAPAAPKQDKKYGLEVKKRSSKRESEDDKKKKRRRSSSPRVDRHKKSSKREKRRDSQSSDDVAEDKRKKKSRKSGHRLPILNFLNKLNQLISGVLVL